MELLSDCSVAQNQIARLSRGWKKVEDQLEYLADYWPSLCEQYKAFRSSAELVSTIPWNMKGQALGKGFSVIATPLAVGSGEQQSIYGELLVLVDRPFGQEKVQAARLLIDGELTLYSKPGVAITERGDDTVPFKLFVSIVSQVLSTEMA